AEARMSGTREKAATSIKGYRETWRRFLAFVGSNKTFTTLDVDRYFAKRRKDGISKNTQRTEFFQIKALAVCNKLEWPYTKYDVPQVKEKTSTPTLNPDDLEQIILNQHLYTDTERFYLAIATVFGCRREAMAQMIKRDYDDTTILIRGVHGSDTVKHAIPDVIRPILDNCWSGNHGIDALSLIFRRIAKKSGLKIEKGFGWHSIRRCVTSVMSYVLPANGLAPSLWAQYAGWAGEVTGATFMGSAMMGHYTHPEVLNSDYMRKLNVLTGETHDNDPYWIDHSIYLVHPLLKTWEQALKKHPVVKDE
ncbi:MAG: hypothetical protein PHI12_11985, partial [Dehalococcoidales bacterium]|nr:hypothetical protein [Dehalococcoidales bacterium]